MNTDVTSNSEFDEIVVLIEAARRRAYQAVNHSLIELYWQVGAYISGKLAAAEWGDGVVDQLARHLAHTQPGLKGFTRPNLFRMRQFYEAYQGDEIVSPLVRQLGIGPLSHSKLSTLLRVLQAEVVSAVLTQLGSGKVSPAVAQLTSSVDCRHSRVGTHPSFPRRRESTGTVTDSHQ